MESTREQRSPEEGEAGSLDAVLHFNRTRLASFSDGPFCQLIRGGHLEDGVKRDVFLACVQLFSRRMQTLMFTRQASCADPRFYGVFLRHLNEEIGHDDLLAERDGAREIYDPTLNATLCWFSYQMILLDNVDKAALAHLVLESAGDLAYRLMAPILGKHTSNEFFTIHAEIDCDHAAIGIPLLADQHPSTYRRLSSVLREGWDMLDATTLRIVHLVEAAA